MATTALVTGGAGFIGSHVVDRMLAEGFRTVVVDNLSNGRRENVNPQATFYAVDIASPELRQVFEKERPQVVLHLAAQASVTRSVDDPVEDARVNVLGGINLLNLCAEFGVEHVVYSSSGGALYGEPERLPCTEDHPIRPLSPYGASKYSLEVFLDTLARLRGFTYTTLRYGNVYGPRQDPFGEAGVVAIFTARMLRNEPVTIFGDGNQERDFIYVSDVVEANVQALTHRTNRAYHVASGTGATVNEIAHRLARLTGYQREPEYAPARPGEVYKVYLDISRARQDLRWEPWVSLEEGLALTVQYFRERQG